MPQTMARAQCGTLGDSPVTRSVRAGTDRADPPVGSAYFRKLVPLGQWRRLQQIELVETPVVVVEHQARLYRDPPTGTLYASPFPPEVANASLCGPRHSAFIGYLKGRLPDVLYADLGFLQDAMGLNLSTGQLAKIIRRPTPC
jgi:hypothetical protein